MRGIRISVWMVVMLWTAMAAAREVPLTLQFQTVLTDPSGAPLPSGEVAMEFRITDAEGTPLYTEQQTVPVLSGQVATLIGHGTDPATSQAASGLPFEVFAPEAARRLEVWVNGELLDDPYEIASVPYALWSQRALEVADGGVTDKALAIGSVQFTHLAPATLDAVTTHLLQQPAFTAAVGAAATGAKRIALDMPLTYSGATDVDGALRDLDRAIKAREEKNVSRGGDSMQGALRFVANGAETAAVEASSGKITSRGGLAVLLGGASIVGETAISGKTSITGDTSIDGTANITGTMNVAGAASLTGGATISNGLIVGSGDLAISIGNLTLSGTVDGVDVGNHAAATVAHGSDGNVVGAKTLKDAIDGVTTANNTAVSNHAIETVTHGAKGAIVGKETLDVAVDGLQEQIDTKAAASDLTDHTGKADDAVHGIGATVDTKLKDYVTQTDLTTALSPLNTSIAQPAYPRVRAAAYVHIKNDINSEGDTLLIYEKAEYFNAEFHMLGGGLTKFRLKFKQAIEPPYFISAMTSDLAKPIGFDPATADAGGVDILLPPSTWPTIGLGPAISIVVMK